MVVEQPSLLIYPEGEGACLRGVDSRKGCLHGKASGHSQEWHPAIHRNGGDEVSSYSVTAFFGAIFDPLFFSAMKRTKMGDSLTGGTNDVNPQFQTMNVVESAANTFTQSTINVPVLRVGMSSSRAQVIELLGIDVFWPKGDLGSADQIDIQLSTSSKTALSTLDDPDVVIRDYKENNLVGAAGMYEVTGYKRYDFTDGAGHGIIIATPQLFWAVQGTSQGSALTLAGRLFYRFKNVSLTEFVGLSLQQN